jgi:hypothetical protein
LNGLLFRAAPIICRGAEIISGVPLLNKKSSGFRMSTAVTSSKCTEEPAHIAGAMRK